MLREAGSTWEADGPRLPPALCPAGAPACLMLSLLISERAVWG